MDDLFALSGAVLVKVGTRGIGRAISLRFARAGAMDAGAERATEVLLQVLGLGAGRADQGVLPPATNYRSKRI